MVYINTELPPRELPLFKFLKFSTWYDCASAGFLPSQVLCGCLPSQDSMQLLALPSQDTVPACSHGLAVLVSLTQSSQKTEIQCLLPLTSLPWLLLLMPCSLPLRAQAGPCLPSLTERKKLGPPRREVM